MYTVVLPIILEDIINQVKFVADDILFFFFFFCLFSFVFFQRN